METAFPYSVIESDKVPSSIVLVCLSFLLSMGGMEIRLENHGPKTSPLRSLGWRIFLWFSCTEKEIVDALKLNCPLRSEEEMESICAALWKTPPELYALYERKATGRDHSIQRYEHDTKANPWKIPLYCLRYSVNPKVQNSQLGYEGMGGSGVS